METGCLGLLSVLAAVAAWILAWTLRGRVAALEQRGESFEVHRRLTQLEREVAALRPSSVGATHASPTPPPEAMPSAVVPPPARAQQAAPLPPPVEPVPSAVAPPPVGATPASPMPSPKPAPPAAPPPPPKPAFDWERLVGVKLFSWVAGIALVVAAVFFLRYSVEQGWLGPPVRMALGLLTGLGLLVGCELKAARHYRVTANALDGAGIAILFATFFAAHTLWHLVPSLATFLLMALVAATAVLLSIRRDSVFIALLGLLGGFATPALLATGEDRPISLFSYLALLNLGLAWVAAKKRWPLLAALSLVATTLYQWGWVVRYFSSGALPTGLGVFLLFPVLFVVMLLLRRPKDSEEPVPALARTATWSAVLPLAFALYLAAVPAYGARYLLLFGFLGLLVAGLAAISIWRGPGWLHLAGAGSALLVFAVWFASSYGKSGAWPLILAVVLGFVAFFLVVTLAAHRLGWKRLTEEAPWAVYAAPLLLFAFPVLAFLEPATARPVLLFGLLLLLVAAVGGTALAIRKPAMYFLGAAMALLAQWLWMAKRLTADGVLAALVVLSAFAAFFLALPFVARRFGAEAKPWRIGLYLATAAPLLMLYAAVQSEIATQPWPLLAVLAVLALAYGVAALKAEEGGLLAAGLAVSQLFLMVWDGNAQVAPWPATATLGAVLLAVLAVGTYFLARRRQPDEAGPTGSSQAGPFVVAAALALLLGQGVVMGATAEPGYPGLAVVAAAHLALVVLWLVLAAASRRHLLAVVAVPVAALAFGVFKATHLSAESWRGELVFLVLLYAPFALYPLVLGRRALGARGPHLAAILATAPVFLFGRAAMLRGGLDTIIGLLPLTLGAVLAWTLWRLLRLEPAGERDRGRLALVAGAVLAMVTVAIPLQLEKQWITVGWALLALALVWLYGRIRHPGLLTWALGLFVAVFVRLAANPAVLTYHPRSSVPVFNWYLYTYLAAALSMFGAVWLLWRMRQEPGHEAASDRILGGPKAIPILAAGGTVLLFLLLNIEIADYFSTGTSLTFGFLSGEASLAENLATTIGWGVFAMALLVAGLVVRQKAVRVCAIVLLSITIGKAFLFDLSRLGGLYRVASFVGLAVCLAGVALLLQKFVLRAREGEE